jgi:N-(5-amino-5-carboxypentanoyl)-L-cysteinyl-D-valine synthase
MLPPGEGGADSYLGNLAGQLRRHRLVLFNNRHLDTPAESLEALAEYHVEHVKRLQPAGPYHLLGWSFGGVLALEIANQLARQGDAIHSLLFVDTYFDVRRAAVDIGMPTADDLLDPINYGYRPNRADLDRLDRQTRSVVLFKASEPNDIVSSDDQRRLFDHYLRTPCNNLDSLFVVGDIRVAHLRGESHHSWVRNSDAVEAVARIIEEMLEES